MVPYHAFYLVRHNASGYARMLKVGAALCGSRSCAVELHQRPHLALLIIRQYQLDEMKESLFGHESPKGCFCAPALLIFRAEKSHLYKWIKITFWIRSVTTKYML